MSQIEIERSPAAVTIIIHSAKPGVIIGRGGQGIEELKKKIKKQLLEPKTTLNINIKEVTNPNLSAELVLQSMIADIEKRIPFCLPDLDNQEEVPYSIYSHPCLIF